jgi:hypothetical protein
LPKRNTVTLIVSGVVYYSADAKGHHHRPRRYRAFGRDRTADHEGVVFLELGLMNPVSTPPCAKRWTGMSSSSTSARPPG